ncbi:MAG: hypothetical protein JSS02_09480 [Planctomycetes bacterium]|nr:hypothetical protein [Planctomycetota bacterium]
MQHESETRNTIWGVMVGVACAALLMFYVIHSGALAGGSRSCRTCRDPGGAAPNWRSAGSTSQPGR